MFKLTEQDLRVAKPLANIFMASIVLVGIAFGTSNLELLGLLQGFFPILALIVLYYSLKLLTEQERSLMFPFLLMAGAQSIIDSYEAFEATRQGVELDIYIVGTHFFIGLYHFVAFWGYKSILPTWGRYATLIGGTSQILAAALTLLDRNDLHDIVDTAFPLLLFFWIALRNIMVKATPTD